MSLSEVWENSAAFKWLMSMIGLLLVAAILTTGKAYVELREVVVKVEAMDTRVANIERRVWPLPGGVGGE